MVEITYQMVLSTLQTLSIMVGIGYYVMTLNYTRRNQEETLRTRNAALFNQTIGQALMKTEAIKHIMCVEDNPFSSIEEYNELLKDPDYRLSNAWLRKMYEMFGIYLKKGIVDIEMFAQVQPYFHGWWWEMSKDAIFDTRKRMNIPSFYRNLEYLMNALQEYYKEHPELKT
jgi:hypothetical protein